MAAALSQSRPAAGREGLQSTNLLRDLYQIAELIELCFGARLDASGMAAVREMKAVARLGPILGLLAALDRAGMGLGMGYVWRAEGRVVGNVSVYRGDVHPRLGSGYLIANVAVHPDYRRHGIARALMVAGMGLVRRQRGAWVALEVDADNEAALALYDDLAFERHETLDQWEAPHVLTPLPSGGGPGWPVRRRRREVAAEADLIYNRARQGGMAWTRPIKRSDIYDMGALFGLGQRIHWVQPAPDDPQRLLGAMWVEAGSLQQPRLSLFLDPELRDAAGRRALAARVLSSPGLRGRTLRLETGSDDPPVEEFLREAGFRKVRSLAQMRKLLAD